MAQEDGSGQPPLGYIAIEINEAKFLFTEQDFRDIVLAVVPAFFQDSSMEAPDHVSDLIRGGLKSVAVMPTGFGKPNVLNTLLFAVYGANAPVLNKKQDKLPVIWQAIADFVVAKAKSSRIVINAEELSDGVYKVLSVVTYPLFGGTARVHSEPRLLAEPRP